MKQSEKETSWLNVPDNHGITRLDRITIGVYSALIIVSFTFSILFIILAIMNKSILKLLLALGYVLIGIVAIRFTLRYTTHERRRISERPGLA